MMVALWRGRLAGLEVDAGRPGENAHHRLEQRSLDPLAAPAAMARLEREQNSLHGEDSPEQVADRDSDPRRPALAAAGHAHQSRHSLRDLVEAGKVAQRSGRAEARDAATDDARIACGQLRVAETHRIHDTGAEIVDHDVGRIDQPFHQRAAFGTLEVDLDALFRSIRAQEKIAVDAAGVPELRARAAHRFDLEDFGAIVTE